MSARGSFIKATILNQPFAVCPTKMQTYMDMLDEELPRVETEVSIANNNVKYSLVGDIAVISIDGAMYKKNMNGACGETVVSYQDINKAIDKAEADSDVKTILFRVDTPGGSVAGAEETRYKIKSSKKKTVTFYENLGASGGMWIFTASNELYAAPTTWLGSIGVVVEYKKIKENGEEEYETITSESAPNKRATSNEDLRDKMITMVNEIENDFFAVLKENTGYEKEFLVETFNNGGIIKAEIAKEKGFIKDISQFSVLLGNLKSNKGDIYMAEEKPSVESETKIIGGFAYTPDNFEMLIESKNKNTETIQALNAQITDLNLQVSNGAEASSRLSQLMEVAEERIALAISHNISDAAAISSIVFAKDDEEASQKTIEAKEKVAAVVNAEEEQGKDAELNAYYEQKRKERNY